MSVELTQHSPRQVLVTEPIGWPANAHLRAVDRRARRYQVLGHRPPHQAGILAALRKSPQLASLGWSATDYNPHTRVSSVLLGKAGKTAVQCRVGGEARAARDSMWRDFGAVLERFGISCLTPAEALKRLNP